MCGKSPILIFLLFVFAQSKFYCTELLKFCFIFLGVLEEPCERENSSVGSLGKTEMELVQAQCLVMNSTSNALYRAANQYRPMSPMPAVNLLALRDSNHLSSVALEQGRLACSNNPPSMCKVANNINYRTGINCFLLSDF